jgi:hypothetical protein
LKPNTILKHRSCLIICVIGIITLLTLSGCGCLFGGGGKEKEKEKPKPAEKSKPEPSPKTSEKSDQPKETQAPKDKPDDQKRLQNGKYDVAQKIGKVNENGDVISGTVNWTKGSVSAIGYGMAPKDADPQVAPLLAREAAYTVALANLLEITKGVKITSTSTVENFTFKDQKVEKSVEGVIMGAKIIKEDIKKDGQVFKAVVEVAIILDDLTGAMPSNIADISASPKSMSDLIKPVVAYQYPTLNAIDPNNEILLTSERTNLDKITETLNKPENKTEQKSEVATKLSEEIQVIKSIQEKEPQKPEEEYTGIVINASGLNVTYAIYPVIFAKKGDGFVMLYGDEAMNRPGKDVELWAIWVTNLSDAMNEESVKSNPLIINAIGINERGEPVIDEKDVEKIESIEKKYGFLEKAKVVIVTQPTT